MDQGRNKIAYGNSSADLLRGDNNQQIISNIWNEPFPDDLKTIKGNTALFDKTFNKTHTNLNNRRGAIKVEVEFSDGGVQLIDIGTFIINKVNEESDNVVSLSLEDLAKPLMNKSADKVKSGFEWYRNVPVKFLVEELIKQVYTDRRNGEVPRKYIIEGIRPKSINSVQIISNLGKPPVFTRLSNLFNTNGNTNVILRANINNFGELLYLGIGSQLYSFNELTQVYNYIGTLLGEYSKVFSIKKLWKNDNDGMIYGVAWPDEDGDNLVNVEMSEINPNIPYSIPIGNEFILFKADNDGISVLFDSSKPDDFLTMKYKLFSGEYHIVPPYFKGVYSVQQDWNDLNNVTFPIITANGTPWTHFKQVVTSIGRVNISDGIKANSVVYQQGYSENIGIPFAQRIGLILNKNLYSYLPSFKEGLNEQSYVQKFGLNVYPEIGYWIGSKDYQYTFSEIYKFHSRPRLVIKLLNSLTQTVDKYIRNSDVKSNFILTTYPTLSPYNDYSTDERYSGYFTALRYNNYQEKWEILPYTEKAVEKFDPGYFGLYDEGLIQPQVPWSSVAWPWLKYTSGQTGATTFLPNYGTKGGIFIQTFNKSWDNNNNPFDVRRRCMTQEDLTGSANSDATPTELNLRCFIFDIASGTYHTQTTLDSLLIRTTNSKTYPIQITATTSDLDNNILYIAGYSYTNKNDYSNKDIGAYVKHYTHLFKITFSGVADSITSVVLNTSNLWDIMITEMVLLKDPQVSDKLLISAYDITKILDSSSFTDRPILGKCFNLYTHSTTTTAMTIVTNSANIWQYRKLTLSPNLSTNNEQTIYFVNPMDRTEGIAQETLKKITFPDNLGTPWFEAKPLGRISDATFGESNCLSNLEVIKYGSDPETVYGVSSAYYANPINKTSSKNYLWKYDSYLSGIIELADFSGLKIWDALSQLAQSFNFIMGFDNETFFFIPKSTSSVPDITLNIDYDPILEAKKSLDWDVKNIVHATPYRSIKKPITWNIIIGPNVLDTLNDDGRIIVSAGLIIRHEDNAPKNILLKTIIKGEIPPVVDKNGSTIQTPLRMAYLIYNNVIETKLLRDVSNADVIIPLPSFFGDNLSSLLGIGDIFTIQNTDSNGDTFFITRRIINVNFNTNEITLESNLGREFKAFTSVSIYRGFDVGDGLLRNNSWSNEGVTFIIDGIIKNGIEENTRIIEVGSIKNLGIGTIITLGDLSGEYEIVGLISSVESLKQTIKFKAFNGDLIASGTYSELVSSIIRGYWVPKDPVLNILTEVGGSKVFVGFKTFSKGTMWSNSRGEDRIEIKSEGLVLESNTNAVMSFLDIDSVNLYGEKPLTLNNNRFIQTKLLEYQGRLTLNWNSKPRMIFKLKNLIQVVDSGGNSFSLPIFKLLNISDKKLWKIRIISRKKLPAFEGFYDDFYIIDHNFNLVNFTQSLTLREENPY